MKIFLISPVRQITTEEQAKITEYVDLLESQGHKVHWPIRDTDQNDPIGMFICSANFQGIKNADEIHIWFNPTSSGSLFDLGMAFTCWHLDEDKKFIFVNKDAFPDNLQGKSFINVLKWLDENT